MSSTGTLKHISTEYRIEGNALHSGWLLFDRVNSESLAKALLGSWRKTRPAMKFRLKVVSTTTTERVIEEDK